MLTADAVPRFTPYVGRDAGTPRCAGCPAVSHAPAAAVRPAVW